MNNENHKDKITLYLTLSLAHHQPEVSAIFSSLQQSFIQSRVLVEQLESLCYLVQHPVMLHIPNDD